MPWRIEGVQKVPGTLIALFALSVASGPGSAEPENVPSAGEEPSRAIECLTLAIAYEAGYESLEGRQAVAQVVLNRLRNRAFPKTVCDVVFAGSLRRTGCQFTFTCDGSLYRRRLPQAVLEAARIVAEDVLAGRVPDRVASATHYHADYVSPYWAPTLHRTVKIGAHIFYRSASGNAEGTPGAIGALPPDVALTTASDAQGATGHGVAKQVFAPWGLAPPVPSAAPR